MPAAPWRGMTQGGISVGKGPRAVHSGSPRTGSLLWCRPATYIRHGHQSMTGDEFRDHIAALLRTRYDNVQTEVKLTAKKADICFQIQAGPRRRIRAAAECKHWGRALTRDNVKDILADYDPARQKGEINEVWIICDQTPSPGAREYVEAYAVLPIDDGYRVRAGDHRFSSHDYLSNQFLQGRPNLEVLTSHLVFTAPTKRRSIFTLISKNGLRTIRQVLSRSGPATAWVRPAIPNFLHPFSPSGVATITDIESQS